MLTKEQIRAAAVKTVGEHAAHLVVALRGHDPDEPRYSAVNLVALMELFAEQLAAEESPDIVAVIDARMGKGWTRELAENLKQ